MNAWISESDENARQLFRMEEIYHLGKFDHYADEQRMANAEKRLYKQLSQEKKKKDKVLHMHRWMRYAAILAVALLMGGWCRILVLQPAGASDAGSRCQ